MNNINASISEVVFPLAAAEHRRRVRACFLGKAIGGTLGMPFEGDEGPFELTYYDPLPAGAAPNDDLDLQVAWGMTLAAMKRPLVSREWIADAWLRHNFFCCDEYGIARRNLLAGIRPPLSGSYDNPFVNGMGAAIRSELWACLAPGKPKLAAAYAREDACVDHAGTGIDAEAFLAAVQSAAFVQSEPAELLEAGLRQIPADSPIAAVTHLVIDLCAAGQEWRRVRDAILERFGHESFTDVTMNLGFVVLGLLAGGGDFGRSICIAANCGQDTDCTAATVGATLGILNPDGIGPAWSKPIGPELVLSEPVRGVNAPATVREFADTVVEIARRLELRPPPQATEASLPAQTTRPLCAFAGELPRMPHIPFPMLEAPDPANGWRPMHLSTFYMDMPAREFTAPVMLLRVPLRVSTEAAVRIVFNSPQNHRVWLDGHYVFGRECGPFIPASHRTPLNQYHDCTLSAGEHELRIAVARPADDAEAQWMIGAYDRETLLWKPEIFVRQGGGGSW